MTPDDDDQPLPMPMDVDMDVNVDVDVDKGDAGPPKKPKMMGGGEERKGNRSKLPWVEKYRPQR